MSQTKGIKVGAPLCVLHSELDLAQRQPCSAFKMRYIAAYMLAVMGGNVDPSAEDVSAILSSVGVDVDLERLNLVIGKMKGQNLEDLMSKGQSMLAVVAGGCARVVEAERVEKDDVQHQHPQDDVTAGETDDPSSDDDDDNLGNLFGD